MDEISRNPQGNLILMNIWPDGINVTNQGAKIFSFVDHFLLPGSYTDSIELNRIQRAKIARERKR